MREIKFRAYRKDGFDPNNTDQVKKYEIYKRRAAPTVEGTNVAYYLPTLEGDLWLRKVSWIATGVKGEHWAIDNVVFRATYEKVEVRE